MFKKIKSYFQKLKERRDYYRYCRVNYKYLTMNDERHQNDRLIDRPMPQLDGIKVGFCNSLEVVYFAFSYVYERLSNLQIRGYRIEVKDDYTVIFHIFTHRPGIVIGKGGKDIDRLQEELSDRLGVKVIVNIVEEKKDIFAPLDCYY